MEGEFKINSVAIYPIEFEHKLIVFNL